MEIIDQAVDDEWGGIEEMEDLVVVKPIKQKNTLNYERALRYSTWKLIDSCPECGGHELTKHHDGSEDMLYVVCNSTTITKAIKRRKTGTKTKQDLAEVDPDSICGFVLSM